MMVALGNKQETPIIGEVVWIQPNPTLHSKLTVLLFNQERAPHKPKWLRYFRKTTKESDFFMNDILLYDFSLTHKGAIRKSTREYLLK